MSFHFDGPPPSANPVLAEATCANPTFQPYTGASVMTCTPNGNDLECVFALALENARTYRP
ncbi:MAG: hypothetical protein V2A79_04495 [Planctomycetota bacterium]